MLFRSPSTVLLDCFNRAKFWKSSQVHSPSRASPVLQPGVRTWSKPSSSHQPLPLCRSEEPGVQLDIMRKGRPPRGARLRWTVWGGQLHLAWLVRGFQTVRRQRCAAAQGKTGKLSHLVRGAMASGVLSATPMNRKSFRTCRKSTRNKSLCMAAS